MRLDPRADLVMRLQAAGFNLPQAYRALACLAGARVPSAARLQAAGRVDAARLMLGSGAAPAAAVQAISGRFAVSERQARRDIRAALR